MNGAAARVTGKDNTDLMAKTTRKTEESTAKPTRVAVRRKTDAGVPAETSSAKTGSAKSASAKSGSAKAAKPASTRRGTATAARPAAIRARKAVPAVANDRASAVVAAEPETIVAQAAVAAEFEAVTVQAAAAEAVPAPRAWTEPTHDEVAERAYHIYLRRQGRPGNPEHDWLQAIEELRAERLAPASR